jgi:beta-glucosidase
MVGKPMGAGGGSSDVVPHYTIAPVDGIENVLKELGNTSAQVELALIDDDNSNLPHYVQAIRDADAVVIMVGSIAEEGADRATLHDQSGVGTVVSMGDTLDWYTQHPNQITTVTRTDDKPLNQEHNSNTIEMISQVLAISEDIATKTALVMKNNAGISLPKANHIIGAAGPAIIEAWFPGQEDGHIVADVLWGKVNPSAKSPVTYPYSGMGFLDAIKGDARYFPGVDVNGKGAVEYLEGLNIGYRWYDANVSGQCELTPQGTNPCVAFPFGHGLSYTEFEVSEPELSVNDSGIRVSVEVKNIGARAGAEVMQVYAGIPSGEQPPKRLVAFNKVSLEPGQSQNLEIAIDFDATNHPFSAFDTASNEWVMPKGEYQVFVGTSSSPEGLYRLGFAH